MIHQLSLPIAASVLSAPGFLSAGSHAAASYVFPETANIANKYFHYFESTYIRRPAALAGPESLRTRIEEIAQLKDNWDGYNGAAIDEPIINQSNAMLGMFNLPPSFITPHPAGTIIFEWETERGCARLEIGNTKYSFYVKPDQGEAAVDGGLISGIDSAKIHSLSHAIMEMVFGQTATSPTVNPIQFSSQLPRERYSY